MVTDLAQIYLYTDLSQIYPYTDLAPKIYPYGPYRELKP
jgi:hypothetical protein